MKKLFLLLIEDLEKLKSERDKLIVDIEDQYGKITTPFPDSQVSNRLVVINPYHDGYKCFYQRGLALENYPLSSLVHRWVWKNYHGRYPRPDFEIHHINKNKYENILWNLIELYRDVHRGFVHGKVIEKNWESGIQQLKDQLGMRDKDFPEYIQNEIKRRKEQQTIKK